MSASAPSPLPVPPGVPALAVEDVGRSFGGVVAVDGVGFTLRAGEILGVIGPNGAGKSTLFGLVAGSLAPDRGTIRIEGVAVEREGAHKRVGRGLARTFQIPKPFPEMSVLDNVVTAATGQSGERVLASLLAPGRVRREEEAAREKAYALVRFLALDHLADRPAKVLSGGQRKLLELARALMAEPRVLLLDEPAAGVNPALLDFIIERIAEINARGIAVLLIEHNMDMIRRLCPSVLVMASGRPLASGTPDAVMSDPRVVEAYLGGSVH
ncbi:ABC transporter ATP-binding protein [Antarcticirhabdus aurantiaca]|uniref:ABC transporter ATP-binding protein n=1 Tax=Antarcticirhabdus aurantiaca TaxID=2606717 RepID=A0ACD4NMN4_9HYPH|nr:ABC transporter ATP-binding protein [Antarcticirhabdus aurantiaca]WAJ28124.1 ABC transporter ATP-binding protein [Jeongeuplla avenae]